MSIHKQKLDAGISLKPSQMGFNIDKKFCEDNIRNLIEVAQKFNIFVRIDMEDVSFVDDTIALFIKLNDTYENVGIVMQAYLRRAIADINHMIENGANIRLCKGAYYWESPKDVYKDGDTINQSYAYLLEKLLGNKCFTGIATHDEKLVFQSLRLIDKLKLGKDRYEFQMLYGVEEELRKIILAQGHPVRVYVPFGKEWFAYSVRRLKENPKMVSYIISNFFNILKKGLSG